jgi:hypothetical protein
MTAENMRKTLQRQWRRPGIGIVVCALGASLCPPSLPAESVRTELIRRQKQTGFTVVLNDHGFKAVLFRQRRLVPLEKFESPFSLVGFPDDPSEFSRLSGVCLSPDKSKLVAWLQKGGSYSLAILGRESTGADVIARDVDVNGVYSRHVSPQCWSLESTQFVYQLDGRLYIYEVAVRQSKYLVDGTNGTWSPDGVWISFTNRGTYYAIHPDGTGLRKLFRNRDAVSSLRWSPDSRLVAYVVELGFLHGGFLDAEVNQLRVRRLSDGSETHLCPDSVDSDGFFQWENRSELIVDHDSKKARSK